MFGVVPPDGPLPRERFLAFRLPSLPPLACHTSPLHSEVSPRDPKAAAGGSSLRRPKPPHATTTHTSGAPQSRRGPRPKRIMSSRKCRKTSSRRRYRPRRRRRSRSSRTLCPFPRPARPTDVVDSDGRGSWGVTSVAPDRPVPPVPVAGDLVGWDQKCSMCPQKGPSHCGPPKDGYRPT